MLLALWSVVSSGCSRNSHTPFFGRIGINHLMDERSLNQAIFGRLRVARTSRYRGAFHQRCGTLASRVANTILLEHRLVFSCDTVLLIMKFTVTVAQFIDRPRNGSYTDLLASGLQHPTAQIVLHAERNRFGRFTRTS